MSYNLLRCSMQKMFLIQVTELFPAFCRVLKVEKFIESGNFIAMFLKRFVRQTVLFSMFSLALSSAADDNGILNA